MPGNFVGSRMIAVVGCSLFCLAAEGVMAQEEAGNLWWRTEAEVTSLLEKKDLVELALELGGKPADSAKLSELVRRFDLFVRAGHRQDAAKSIAALAQLKAQIPDSVLNDMATDLLGREEWELAQRLLEAFSQTEAGWTYLLLRQWKTAGKSVEEIDTWLRQRQPTKPSYWIKVRGQFLSEAGKADSLVRELADDVKQNPSDPERVILYLEVAGQQKDSLDWLAGVYKPARALDAYEIGNRIVERAPQVAASFLERALEMPLGEQEVEQMSRTFQRITTPGQTRTMVLSWMQQALVRAYQRTGQADKAQKIMETLVAGGSGPIDPHLAGMAGQVQQASGARVIESRIQEAEPANKNSSRYWLTRANYYAGRQEVGQAEQAYQSALKLAKALAPKERGLKVQDERREVLGSYVRFLLRTKQSKNALALLRQELMLVSADTAAIDWVVYALLDLDRESGCSIDPTDPLLWGFLQKRVVWDSAEQRILWKLFEKADKADLQKTIARAEKLAVGAHPSRAGTLGWVLTRMKESARAVPLLKDAVARLTQEEDLRSTRFNLFETYLDIGDWKSAEQLFPQASKQLTAHELIPWRSRIAVLAAKAGQKEDALRIWKSCANLDVTKIKSLDELVQAGMRDQLKAFYQELAKRDPQCWVPGVVLAKL